MKKMAFLLLVLFCNIGHTFSQDNIYNIVNKEIVLYDNWAGQSLTLVYENNNYYIHRKIFGSGVAIVGIIIYKVIFDSEYKITASEIASISKNIKDMYNRNEIIEIYCINGLEIYLNGIKIYINEIRDYR
jgi:hypothetical protein